MIFRSGNGVAIVANNAAVAFDKVRSVMELPKEV